MTTLLLHHPSCVEHTPPEGHPERPDRMRAIEHILSSPHFDNLAREEAPLGDKEAVLMAHTPSQLQLIESIAPDEGLERIDEDTWMSPASLEVALRGVGAAIRAVDAVALRDADNAFCAMRPPGHHAESNRAMGFCLFNNAAIAAHHARDTYDLERIAVVDFDVHHGNGTQEIFWADKDLFYGSTHQMPLYPGTGSKTETGEGNIFNAPLSNGDGSEAFREAMTTTVLPALDAFEPELVIISAGFDAHQADPLGGLNLVEEDYVWITLRLMDAADKHADGRIISVLEGGYDLRALATSTGVHIQALMHGSGAT
ncbi:MAG: histone deacetylase family protein [Hyphomicrobiales bacterium]